MTLPTVFTIVAVSYFVLLGVMVLAVINAPIIEEDDTDA